MLENEQKYAFKDNFNDKLVTNFYTQSNSEKSEKYVEIMFDMENDILNDYMDDNDLRLVLTAEQYKEFLTKQLKELENYVN